MSHPASLHWIQYVTIAAYLLLMLGMGWAFKRFNKDTSDYFRGGCRGTWWLVGMGAFMSSFSAWTFTGAAGVAFQAGWSAAIIFLSNAAGFLLNFICTAPWFRQLRATTGPEIIRLRYGAGTQQFYAFMNVLSGLLMAGLHLFGLSIFCSAVFGLPIHWVIVILGVVVLVYSRAGGNWAIMATDFLQGLILLPVTILTAWLALRAMGGWSGFQDMVATQGLTEDFRMIKEPGKFAASAFTWGWASAMMIKSVMGFNTLTSAPRFFSVKNGADARKAALFCFVVMFVGIIVWFLPPMAARLLYADQVNAVAISKPAESAYAVACLNLLPPALIGMVVVSMFSATMSSMDHGLNRNAAIIIKDIYPALARLFGKTPREDSRLLGASRWISFALGILIIGLSLYYSLYDGAGIFEIMINIGAYLTLPMAVPMFLGLFFRRTPNWAAFASAGAALLASLWAAVSPKFGAREWLFQETVFLTFLTGSMTFFLSMLFWEKSSPIYQKQVAEFFQRMHTPVDFEKEVGQANDLKQLVFVGIFAMASGIMILLLLPFAGSADGALQVTFIGLSVALTGLIMWGIGRRNGGER